MSVSAISLLGAPGAGKGTIAAGIKAASSFIHLSTGDLLRDAVKEKSAVGLEAEAFMKRGDLVPDDVVSCILIERIDAGPSDAKYMLDGYPRNLAQAKILKTAFEERGAALSAVFLLEVPAAVTLERLGGRLICRSCGASFHVRNIPPKRQGICDCCGGELYTRSDDTEATILNRLEVFREQSAELFAFYEEQGILIRIDSSQHRDVVAKAILDFLAAGDA